MANVVLFNASGAAQYLLSVHTPDYVDNPNALINPDVSALTNVPVSDWKRSGNLVVEMTGPEKTARDAAVLLAIRDENRSTAGIVPDLIDPHGVEWRAVSMMVLDELNDLRTWIRNFKTQVAASSSLADLKTRVAGLPNMPDRTVAQMKTTYANKVNNGNAD